MEDIVEERISEMEDRSVEKIQDEAQKNKKNKKHRREDKGHQG